MRGGADFRIAVATASGNPFCRRVFEGPGNLDGKAGQIPA